MKRLQKITITREPVHPKLKQMQGAGVRPSMDRVSPYKPVAGSGMNKEDSWSQRTVITGGGTKKMSEGSVKRSSGPSLKSSGGDRM